MYVPKQIVIVGGGAAGFFAAINCVEQNPGYQISILEKTSKVLSKVKVSGGGRCNVTNACFDVRELVKYYPRGYKEMLGAFNRFQPRDTIEWFNKKNVKLKSETDNRIFPVSNQSQTIIDCFLKETLKHKINIQTRTSVDKIIPPDKNNVQWKIITTDQKVIEADALIIASGSSSKIWEILSGLGHEIIEPVPSLFTFNIKDIRINGLAGISVPNVEVFIQGTKLNSTGPLLITHWGLSGPAILKLSAFGARVLHDKKYKFKLIANFLPGRNIEDVNKLLIKHKTKDARKRVSTNTLFNIPQRLWERICQFVGIKEDQIWNGVSKLQINKLSEALVRSSFDVNGKSTFKEEFVTAGGIDLKEVNFKTMESKIHPGIYFTGEVLNIDAVTGGFNFQSAWTTAWIAANSI